MNKPKVPRSPWRETVRARIDDLVVEAETFSDGDHVEETRKLARNHLSEATEAVYMSGPIVWATGVAVERAWTRVHDAEVALSCIAPMQHLTANRARILALAELCLPKDDKRLADMKAKLMRCERGETTAEDSAVSPEQRTPIVISEDSHSRREAYTSALRVTYEASDNYYRQLRNFRNIILAGIAAASGLAIAVGLVGFWAPRVMPLCFTPLPGRTFCPTGGTSPGRGDVALLEFLGLIGGSIAALVRIRAIRGTNAPYAVPTALAALKLPLGALTGFLGVLLIRAAFVPGLSQLDSQPQILAWGFLFGYAQQVLTRLVDQRGQSVLNSAPTTEPNSGQNGTLTSD